MQPLVATDPTAGWIFAAATGAWFLTEDYRTYMRETKRLVPFVV